MDLIPLWRFYGLYGPSIITLDCDISISNHMWARYTSAHSLVYVYNKHRNVISARKLCSSTCKRLGLVLGSRLSRTHYASPPDYEIIPSLEIVEPTCLSKALLALGRYIIASENVLCSEALRRANSFLFCLELITNFKATFHLWECSEKMRSFGKLFWRLYMLTLQTLTLLSFHCVR